ncbi:MAG: hypothetical protein HUJ80_06470 [Firmicutes bacterium]|nr:hypothetical protein [Bacillota bacterium]
MITLLFLIMMAVVFGKLFLLAVRAAWGITKILLWLIFLPITIAVLFFSGLVQIAFPILAIIGLVSLFS